MASFRPVNTTLSPDAYGRNGGEETTPTTPRPSTAPTSRMEDPTTPTRATFGAMAEQKPLPGAPFNPAIAHTESHEPTQTSLHASNSQKSNKSRDSEDVEMGDDNTDGPEEESEPESVDVDGSRSSKKKKSQRFYCTDYPPCTLSFTRSEHLARHIRYVKPVLRNVSRHPYFTSHRINTTPENTQVKDPFSVTAHADFLDWITCGSMLKPSM